MVSHVHFLYKATHIEKIYTSFIKHLLKHLHLLSIKQLQVTSVYGNVIFCETFEHCHVGLNYQIS